MYKELKNNSVLFRQSCFCLTLFFAFFSLFTVCSVLPLDVECCKGSDSVNNSHLAAFPSGETDDNAAVRWDYRCRTNMALRLDNRNNYRSTIPMQGNSAELLATPCCTGSVNNAYIWHKQPLLTYYRRLWQKILPPRAGPCA